MYEEGSYTGMSYGTFDTTYRSWGNETLMNALGEFQGEWYYVFPPVNLDPTQAPTASELPANCPDGTAEGKPLQFLLRTDYGLAYRNMKGALLFSLDDTSVSGIFNCSGTYEGQDFNFIEYYILTGKGTGVYSCIESIMLYGGLGGGMSSAFNKIYLNSLNMNTGFFDRSTNGLPGTYYLEIVAPEGCIPAK